MDQSQNASQQAGQAVGQAQVSFIFFSHNMYLDINAFLTFLYIIFKLL
jgi:hypothetical protein